MEINQLLFEQFNLILTEAEIAQSMIPELENRFDYISSAKKRVTIDDLYHFKNTFEKQKHCIFPLPYNHQLNGELIRQLIDLVQTREQLDNALEVAGYNIFETRTHVLTRLFSMYSTQECEENQKITIQNKFPTDIEIGAHCIFLNINEICQQQKDLIPCKIELFQVQHEHQPTPLHGESRDRFFFLVCNRINFEPYFMIQIGNDIYHSISGPMSFFNTLVYYFMHLKNSFFDALSQSECKDILEAPAKYILNYENEYRKTGPYSRYYQ